MKMRQNNDPINDDLTFDTNYHLKRLLECAIALSTKKSGEFTKCCITCDTFNEKEEICTKYNMKPPARVIAFGCPEYVNDIPF